jgi:hypothetical protein
MRGQSLTATNATLNVRYHWRIGRTGVHLPIRANVRNWPVSGDRDRTGLTRLSPSDKSPGNGSARPDEHRPLLDLW